MSTDLTRLPKLADEINREHGLAEAALRSGLEHARAAGELLRQAKALVPHGGWLSWLSEHVRFSTRTAQAYMRVAERWPELESKAQPVALLTFRDALKLMAEAPAEEGGGGLALEIPAPALSPGHRYEIVGRAGGVKRLVQLDEHPEHPGYWTIVCYALGDSRGDGIADYIGRGVLRSAVLECLPLLVPAGFVAEGGWHERQAVEGLPQAARWHREDSQCRP